MEDGHLNKCKSCCKLQAKEREAILRLNPEWVEKERKRGRDKSIRLDYKNKYKTSKQARDKWKEKYPEKDLCRRKVSGIKVESGFNHHHWSYKEEHWFDIIKLSITNHYRIHTYITYDQSSFMYRTREGTLLDTKEKHIEYMNAVFKLPY